MSQNTARKIAKVIAIITIIAMVVTSFSFVFFSAAPSVVYAASTATVPAAATDSEKVDVELAFMKDLMALIKKNYKDDITYDQMIKGAYQGIFTSLDRHSIYYDTQEAKDNFETTVDGEFTGVGVSLDTADGRCLVVAPIAGTPADRAGILPGDVIVELDGKDVRGLTGDEIVSKLRGPAGSKVTIGIERVNHSVVMMFSLVREVIKVKAVTFKMLDNSIGYIKIANFDNDTDKEFTAAKLQLIKQGMKSLILDLRNNPGGYIMPATNIANQLMPVGPIMHFEQQGKITETISANGFSITHVPIAVLINNGSASASEILAGALQDSGAGVLVGTQSYGKGTAQQVMDLANGDAMKLSEYYFLTPKKTKINQIGLTPNYVVDNKIGTEAELKKMTETVADFAPMAETSKPKAGDIGLNVFGAQQRLTFLGYKLAATGKMDGATVTAVKAFQKASGIYVYGVLDQTTRTKLLQAVTDYISAASVDGSDPQLSKAVELLK